MQSKTYRYYLRAYYTFKTAYHMVQCYVMNKSDQYGPESCMNEIDIIDYMISINEDMETILNYLDNNDQAPDHVYDHALYKLNGLRGAIGLEKYIYGTAGLYARICATAAEVMKHYII